MKTAGLIPKTAKIKVQGLKARCVYRYARERAVVKASFDASLIHLRRFDEQHVRSAAGCKKDARKNAVRQISSFIGVLEVRVWVPK